MTPEQFVYWLQGFMEISGNKELSAGQMIIVQDHLNLVLHKVTPVRPGPGVKEVQELQETIERLKQQVPIKKCSKSLKERVIGNIRIPRLKQSSDSHPDQRIYC